MEQIDDLQKRLSRPIKDLDDVRQAMASLKELRENEIEIDSSLSPVEVCGLNKSFLVMSQQAALLALTIGYLATV